MTWNAEVDLPPKLFSNVRVSVTASEDTAPSGMALDSRRLLHDG